jgi:alpha-L-rhamnosidase
MWTTPASSAEMMPGVRAVLAFFDRYARPDGLLGDMPWWNYVDWVNSWRSGRPPSEPGLMPASIQLQWLLAFQYARDLERGAGRPAEARRCAERENQLKSTHPIHVLGRKTAPVHRRSAAHQHPSQHANVLAVLAGLPAEGARPDGTCRSR